MTFINTAEDPIQVGVVYQHVIDMTGADWSLYAAADSIHSVLHRHCSSWSLYQFILPEQAQQRSAAQQNSPGD